MKKIQSKTITETVHIEDPSRAVVLNEMEKLRGEGYRCSSLDIGFVENNKEQQGVYFFIAKKKTVLETLFPKTDEEKNKNEKHSFIVKPLFATADKNGHYIDVSPNIAECQEWLKEDDNKEAKTIIGGYGIFNTHTDTMPDDAVDFHYSYGEAQQELSRFLENFIS